MGSYVTRTENTRLGGPHEQDRSFRAGGHRRGEWVREGTREDLARFSGAPVCVSRVFEGERSDDKAFLAEKIPGDVNCSLLVELRNQLPTSGEWFLLRARSSLSEYQREQLVGCFEQGMGEEAAANALGVSKYAVRCLFRRFQLHGRLCLVEKPTKQHYSFEIKKEVVQRHLAGETTMDLAREFDLSSDQLVKDWSRQWRRGGDEALKPKPKGRPKDSTVSKPLIEEEKLRRQVQ